MVLGNCNRNGPTLPVVACSSNAVVSNLVKVVSNPLTKIVTNQLGAAVVAGFTAYVTAAIIYDPDFNESEGSKQELISELWKASYITWKWYMGLGPPPEIYDDRTRNV
jgi:hypothetical protein